MLRSSSPHDAFDLAKVAELLRNEEERFTREHPRSARLFERASRSLLNGVPMNWMEKWASPFPLFLATAFGAELTDVDGHRYVDFCLGDTGAMAGHASPAVVAAVERRVASGTTAMVPTEDAVWVAEELQRRFGLPYWQIAMTATDANRFALRIARELTGRPKTLVFNWCYHGTVDEALAVLDGDGRPARRPGVLGASQPARETSRVVEFNDLAALADELSHGDVACVLAEPALTNIGIILPEPGFHEALRALTREHNVLLALDETHTFCAGPGGATARWGLEPDILVIGKAVGGGIPAAALGLSADVADAVAEAVKEPGMNISGIGGTLSGNALATAAARATLESVLVEDAFREMEQRAERWEAGTESLIEDRGLPWSVTRLGCRAEYWFGRGLRTGGGAVAQSQELVEDYLHLFALNRGVLLTPFHNMALMCPATTDEDVDLHTAVFAEALDTLCA